jgi:predicted dehydrogenase
MNKIKKYSLTIIGGGDISVGYDKPNSDNIQTHIHAAFKHPNIKLDCLVEPSRRKIQYIRKKWKGDYSCEESVDEALNKYRSDIIIIASPTETHLSIIDKITSTYIPKIIVCEKPTVANIHQLKTLKSLVFDRKIKIITNFQRRFHPAINRIRSILTDESTKIYHFYASFPKGMMHNGSHLIDLLFAVFGRNIKIQPISFVERNKDYFGQFTVRIGDINGFIGNIDNDNISLFELTIFTNNYKIEFNNDYVRITGVSPHPEFESYIRYGVVENFSNKDSIYNSLKAVINAIEDDSYCEKIMTEQSKVCDAIFSIPDILR